MPQSFLKRMTNRWTRKVHRWVAIAAALPLLVIISSGILLQLKKNWSWIQPATAQGRGGGMKLTIDDILEAARRVEIAQVESWDDIDRLDVRPERGVVKVRTKSRWEIQLDLATGAVLQTKYRRSDLIESIHDGSWFADVVKRWVFLPTAVVLLGLWVTGVYLWILPINAKRSARKRNALARRGRPNSLPKSREERDSR